MEQNHCINIPNGMSFLGDVSNNWEKFKRRLQHDLASKKSDKLKLSLLLNQMGEREAIEVFKTFVYTAEESEDNYNDVVRKFDEYCKPRKNVVLDRFNFFSRAQEVGESIDDYVTELRKLALECSFENQTDSLIRDRLILGISDKKVQERLLREPDLLLPEAIEICSANEIGKLQMKEIQGIEDVAVTEVKKENMPETPSYSNSCFQIQTEVEEIELNSVKEETSVVECNPSTRGKATCYICNFTFTRKGDLVQHLTAHTCEKLLSCVVCDFASTNPAILNVHLRTHTKKTTFTCKICSYKGKCEVHRRKQTKFKRKESFLCEICDSVFADQEIFNSHLRTHSTDDKPFACEICGYKCSRKFSLQIHSRICKYI